MVPFFECRQDLPTQPECQVSGIKQQQRPGRGSGLLGITSPQLKKDIGGIPLADTSTSRTATEGAQQLLGCGD
jgi:hypothetical protein